MIGSRKRLVAALSAYLVLASVREGLALSGQELKVTRTPSLLKRSTDSLNLPRSTILAWLGGTLTCTLLPLTSFLPPNSPHAAVAVPAAAWAIQERNDALCGTGFFTNIMQYRCTELGDISDEGMPRALSEQQMESVGGLLSKFDLSESAERLPSPSPSDRTAPWSSDAGSAASRFATKER